MRHGYPVFLNLEGKTCVVFGTGKNAEEKAQGLRAAGAQVHVITRAFQPGDLEGVFLAIAADDDRSANAEIFAEGERTGVLVNCLDDPPYCRFIFPSIHRQGALVAAISTSGVAPALAVRIRQKLAAEYGPEYAEFLKMAARWRERITEMIPDPAQRKAFWYELVDAGLPELIRDGLAEEAEHRLAILVGSYAARN